ncbi:hypothetical protein Y032_0006g3066 [Ancylostoma ceylanicum]|uniref:TIL domain-containing protein n=1 Tax=Ancylostoma ceylanicum TaxID=53326 RepID=A0A016VQM4_9BILA|nr:hypothetical protein Y032_0006g3066 [Ancylostoma ceylanicum]
MVSSYLSVVFLIVLVCPEIIGARMLKKHDLEVPEFLAEGTTEYPGTDETIEPEESKCDENEEYVECSEKCEPRCDTPVYVDCKFSPACTPRCQCKEGYARHSSGKCVPDGECLLGKIFSKACGPFFICTCCADLGVSSVRRGDFIFNTYRLRTVSRRYRTAHNQYVSKMKSPIRGAILLEEYTGSLVASCLPNGRVRGRSLAGLRFRVNRSEIGQKATWSGKRHTFRI